MANIEDPFRLQLTKEASRSSPGMLLLCQLRMLTIGKLSSCNGLRETTLSVYKKPSFVNQVYMLCKSFFRNAWCLAPQPSLLRKASLEALL
jgi:hypothetical protein